jgi:hypothetical protein
MKEKTYKRAVMATIIIGGGYLAIRVIAFIVECIIYYGK